MYKLLVYNPGETAPRASLSINAASDVLTSIPAALAEHPNCERIEVIMDDSVLFAVDGTGRLLP